MRVLGINDVEVNKHNYVNSMKNKNSSIESNLFEKKIQEVFNNNISQNLISTKNQDGMVVSQPPNYDYYSYDNSISKKSKADMTMDEYKQYFANKMSSIPVGSYYRESFTGSVVITEKAFEKMKADPEWEKSVLNMLKSMYSVNGLPQRSYGVQVIGASSEECYGYTVPIDKNNSFLGNTKSEKSWWKKRNEKIEESIREYEKKKLEQQMQIKASSSKYMDLNTYDISQFILLNSIKNSIMPGQAYKQALVKSDLPYAINKANEIL